MFSKKTLMLAIAVTVSAVTAFAASPTRRSFAIVTEPQTFKHCSAELEKYREAVCTDGLDAFICVNDWSCPDELRDSLKTYFRTRSLAGAVFVGDVPIAMIRKAQHLTSAFKMDEDGAFPMRESSVPSDRFYDDFDLKFDYVCRDTSETNFFYYNLAPESPQYISCDIYTGRIKPSVKRGDPYGEISRYLLKAAAAKSGRNPLDHLVSYSGSGSFSNSLAAWKDETITLKEQMPAAFSSSDGAKFYVFAMYPNMKDILLKEIARDELDLVLFHEHGVPERQYLTDIPEPEDIDGYYTDARYRLRRQLRTAAGRGQDTEALKAEYIKKYGIPSAWLEDWDDPKYEVEDSLYDAATGIMLDDVVKTAPNVRMAIFDACYNGDFREDDCIASRYVLSDGKALVGIGNSVNVLQDKSSSDLLGMLALGYSAGEWMQQVNILESHILGDPTFHFTAPEGAAKPDLYSTDINYWKKYTDAKYPCDIRGLALQKLFTLDAPGLSDLLMKTWKSSDEYMLRLQCMHLLAHYNDGNYSKLLKDGADDPYEFIRRKSTFYLGKVGEDWMADELAAVYMRDYNSLRVAANVGFVCAHFADSLFLKNFDRRLEEAAWVYDKDSFREKAMATFSLACSIESGTGKIFTDKNARGKNFYISGMRNNPYPQYAMPLFSLVKDNSESTALRTECAEVLGWFVRYHGRRELISAITDYLESGTSMPREVRDELVKTKGRLEYYTR